MLELRKIMLVFGLLLLLLQTAACVEQFCRFNQSDPCYAALGHKLNLPMVNASNYDLTIKKRINNTHDDKVCRVKNDIKRVHSCDLYINRTEVTIIKGTLIINSVKREDSGDYRLILYNPDGTETSTYLQVNVEAPVGSVEVSIICSSNQMKSVSCSSDGDQLLYSWTLNGETLMDGNSSIQIKEETKGEITCTVKNNVSQGHNTVSIEDCPGSTTDAVTSSLTSRDSTKTSENGTSFSTDAKSTQNDSSGSLFTLAQYLLITMGCVAVILILLFIIVYCVYRKKQPKSPTPAPPSGDVELIYTHISHQNPNKKDPRKKKETSPDDDVEYSAVRVQKKKNNKPEEEVQYGEVTFSPKRSNTQNQQQPVEECVYSEVHRR